MNELTALRVAAPEATPLSPAVRLAARAALLEEIGDPRARSRRSPVRRRTWIRAGVGVVAVVAAWTTAVVVAAPGPAGTPPGGIELVAFAPPAFPFTLDPTPADLQVTYSADPGGLLHAVWAGDTDDRLVVDISPDEPDLADPADEQDVSVQGRDGYLATETQQSPTGDRLQEVLVLEWADDLWVTLRGEGRFSDRDDLRDAARTLTAQPVDVGLSVRLAPAGWSVYAYKDDTTLTLTDDAQAQTLTVSLPPGPVPADELLAQLEGPVGPVIDGSVNGLPAQLVAVDTGYTGPGGSAGWYLQAQFPDGRTFVVQTPGALTRQQVLELAGQVTYTP
ncbi:hypothetical protein [Modestobacter sp. Leaf380]|uniref:hypothetical protein n=1 Tax=Modestobacter sp. Leaf380 TaxID=1736356 RepID=UPI0006F48088|nr:hypothetical protein [Modestobacter sp. Leaf380]KQS73703.1 hypothetical protein ASG41_03660 [Modestobacter sp. Leaf380]